MTEIVSERVLDTIYAAVDQINQTIDGEPLQKQRETVLFGSKAQLDSLGLINLIVAVEEKVEENFKTAVTLADDRALSREVSPFTTVGTLADYLELLLQEKL